MRVVLSSAARAGMASSLPIVVGALAPWLMWLVAGRLTSGDVAAATMASVAVMIRIVRQWPEVIQVDVWVRRIQRPTLAAVLCGGLTASLVVPGLSAFLLIDAVGLPRASGAVRSYDLATFLSTDVTVGLAGAFGAASLAPNGIARLTDRHSHGAAPRVLPWRSVPGGICIGSGRCLMLDPFSGRLRLGDQSVGRVVTIERPLR